MSINTILKKSAAVLSTVALLSLVYGPVVSADHVDIHISPAAEGAVVLDGNASSTILATFANDLDLASSTSATLEANGTSTATASYGVEVESATTTGDVHWEITVSHATQALAGGVTITEKGYFDADGGTVADSSYGTPTVVSGDLVFEGNSGWEVAAGETFTNVDEIVFDFNSPLGVYTVTRTLVDTATDAEIEESFSFTINLVAEADLEAPDAPTVTFPNTPHATTTNPITISGTAEASSTISITGGSSTSTATTTGGGDWSAVVNLNVDSVNNLSITAEDEEGNVSLATTLAITHSTSTSTGATSTPVISLEGAELMTFFICNVETGESFVDPGFSAVDSTGASITATSTGSVDLTTAGTYTLTYTATDSENNTATTTRTVMVLECSSGGGGGGGGGGNSDGNRGIARAAAVTPPATDIAGNAFGLATLQATLLPPGLVPGFTIGLGTGGPIGLTGGQVLGASTFQFMNNLRIGMSGPEVIELQSRLTATGYYNGPITGFFGQLTLAAVKNFQRANGLPPTGFVGPMTRALLNS